MRSPLQRTSILSLCLLSLHCSPEATPVAPAPTSPGHMEATDTPRARIVLLVSIDTLRADHLGLYGYERNTSPVLDLLATEGVVFEDVSSPSPWTLPAHASMMTGSYPRRHGVMTWSNPLSPGIPTLADWLGEHGFRTGAIVGSEWLGRETFGITRAFDRYSAKDTPAGHRASNRWASDTALDWIRESGEERIFVFLHYFDVHADYVSGPYFEGLFTESYDGPADGTAWQLLRANLPDAYVTFCSEQFEERMCRFGSPENERVIGENLERPELDAADVRHLEGLYDAGIRQLDTELGRLLSILRHEGFLDETLLLVTSDHGEEFREHGRLDHFLAMYQESVRVPLILLGPGVPAGLRIDAPVSLIDIAPTLLSLVGASVPSDAEGLDLSALWGDEAVSASGRFSQRFLYGEAGGGLTLASLTQGRFFPIYRSVRRGRYKLIRSSLSEQPELFDLEADPAEQSNLAETAPDILRELSSELDRRLQLGADPKNSDSRAGLDAATIESLRALGYLVPEAP